MYQKTFKKLPPYFRPYVARSDPALNSGLIPTVLAIKIALSNYQQLEDEYAIPMYPIIGAAALPFRGGLSPHTVEEFANEYRGIKTTTIQSAFRYDFDKKHVIQAIKLLERTLPQHKAIHIPPKEQKQLVQLIAESEKIYKNTIEEIAPIINAVSMYMPKRRERVQHVGLFGYSRGVGKVKLPRAITFTASLYSLGIPPEFIGTGRTIEKAKQFGVEELLQTHYKNLSTDLNRAGCFLNKEVLKKLSTSSVVWNSIQQDIALLEAYVGYPFEPKTPEEKQHLHLTGKIFDALESGQDIQSLVEQAALLRKSLG